VKVLNLEKVSRMKRQSLIYDYCGGQYSSKEAMRIGGVGIGGLKYIDGADKVDEIKRRAYLRSNVETLRNGLGFYLRDEEGNYMLLIQNSEILSISYYKEEDRVQERTSFSLFRACINRGIAYHYSKLMLMEDEIVELHPPKLKIVTTALDEINFECTKLNPMKVKDYFLNSPLADKFNVDYNTFGSII